MDNILFILLAPSLVAGFVGWFTGEQHGFDRAAACVERALPSAPVPDTTEDMDGADGFLERARR